MEQEHGTDAAAICKGVLLRVGMAAAMSTAVLGFLSYHVLPRLRKTDYLRMVSDADAQTALTLAPLVLRRPWPAPSPRSSSWEREW